MVLAAGAIDWNLGRFTDGVEKYTYAVERDPRLLDDKYLEVRCCLALCVCVRKQTLGRRSIHGGIPLLTDPRDHIDYFNTQRERHWPPTMMHMVQKIRDAGTIEGVKSTAVSYFESRGTLI